MFFQLPSRLLPLHAQEDYRVINELGSGSFGKVHLAKLESKDEYDHYFAIKVLKKPHRPSLKEKFLTEVTIHQQLSGHPNIITYYAHSTLYDEFSVRMEYAACGTLFDQLKKRITFAEREAAHILRQIADGLDWIHSHNIVHRDLKLENILVTEESCDGLAVKIGDFGLADYELIPNSLERPCGSCAYAAPEIYLGIKYGKAVDIWSVGVITYALLSNSFPFNNDDTTKLKVIRRRCPFPSIYWKRISPLGIDFVNGMLRKNPQYRPATKEVLQHLWLLSEDYATDMESRESDSSENLGFSETADEIPLFLPQKLVKN